MPIHHKRKRTFRKRPITKKRSTHRKPRSHELMIYSSPGIAPFPSRFRTTFTTSVYGALLSGLGGASGSYLVQLNSPLIPFQTNAIPNSVPTATSLRATGWSSLVNANLYRSFRVISSTLMVEFLPESLLDTIQVVIFPASIGFGGTTGFAMNQPFAKSGLMSATKDDHNSRRGGSQLVCSMSQHKLLGVSYKAIMEDLSGNYVGTYSANPANTSYWNVLWSTPDGVNLASTCKIRMTVKHHTELFNPFNGTTLET